MTCYSAPMFIFTIVKIIKQHMQAIFIFTIYLMIFLFMFKFYYILCIGGRGRGHQTDGKGRFGGRNYSNRGNDRDNTRPRGNGYHRQARTYSNSYQASQNGHVSSDWRPWRPESPLETSIIVLEESNLSWWINEVFIVCLCWAIYASRYLYFEVLLSVTFLTYRNSIDSRPQWLMKMVDAFFSLSLHMKMVYENSIDSRRQRFMKMVDAY